MTLIKVDKVHLCIIVPYIYPPYPHFKGIPWRMLASAWHPIFMSELHCTYIATVISRDSCIITVNLPFSKSPDTVYMPHPPNPTHYQCLLPGFCTHTCSLSFEWQRPEYGTLLLLQCISAPSWTAQCHTCSILPPNVHVAMGA